MKSITANLNSGAGERTGKKRRGRPPGTRKLNSSEGDAAAVVHQPGPSTQDDCLINNSTTDVKRKRGRPPSKKKLSLLTSPGVETQNLDGEIDGGQQHPTPTSNEGTDISHQSPSITTNPS